MRVLLAIVGVLMLSSPAMAADWSAVAPIVRDSIVEIASDDGACTGFVIDNERDFVLTAAHCDGTNLFADLLPAKVKSKDVKTDLMVLYVEGIDRPELKLAKDDPRVGEEAASYGWGYAMNEPLFRTTHVSAKDVTVEGYERARYFAIDTTFVGGQSGGPVVNPLGEVVMLVQLGNAYVGFGVGAETIDDKMGRFFVKEKR